MEVLDKIQTPTVRSGEEELLGNHLVLRELFESLKATFFKSADSKRTAISIAVKLWDGIVDCKPT